MNTKNIVTKEIQTYFHLFMPGFLFLMAFRLEIHVSYTFNEFEATEKTNLTEPPSLLTSVLVVPGCQAATHVSGNRFYDGRD